MTMMKQSATASVNSMMEQREYLMELRDAFKLFDTDQDGLVTLQELNQIFEKLGSDSECKLNPAEIQAMVRAADKDKSGSIDFEEFHELWQKLKHVSTGDTLTEDEREIREEFDKLDIDGSGYISKSEMMKTIDDCEFLSGDKEEEARKCLADIDVDGDGKISYPEFLMVWKFKY